MSSWIEDKTKTFEYKGVKYYTRTDPDGGDKGQVQVWTVKDGRHLGTFPKDKTKPFEKNVNIFDFDPVTDKDIKDIRNDPKFAEATRTSSKNTVIAVTKKACEARGGGADCGKEAEAKSDDIALTANEVRAKDQANKEQQEQQKANAEAKRKEVEKDLKEDVGREDYMKEGEKMMIYPEGRHDTQDYMLFEVLKYLPRGLKNSDNSGGPLKSRANKPKKDNGVRDIVATISLPIPANIQDGNNVAWQKDDIDEISKHLASFTGGALKGKAEVEDLKATVQKAESVDAARLAILNSITGVKAMQREKGAVFNENTELLFNGPGLRKFSFSFRLSPRSASEAKIVQRIIRTFKESMSAKKSKQFFFIKAPNTYWISYMSGETDQLHPWLNKFKECALTNMTVQYAPDGTYATFSDGAMTSYLMQLDFKEIEPVFNTDYEESEVDSIGY